MIHLIGEKYSPILYESININNLCFTLIVTGKLSKISKSSFKRRQYHSSSNNDNLLGHYLAGLIEGDGAIIVPKTVRNQKGKLLYPVVKITFVDKDSPLAQKIKEILNGGTMVHYKNSNYLDPRGARDPREGDLLFQDLNSVRKIAVLLNGRMRTPKIEALHRLIDWLNAKDALVKKSQISKLGLDSSSLGDNP